MTRDRGRLSELAPKPFDPARALRVTGTVLLVPVWGLRLLRHAEGRDPSEALILPRENPVIEYKLPAERADGTVVAGRVYWTYAAVKDEQRQGINRMFSWLRSAARALPPDARFRVLPHAAATARRLDFGFDIVEPNPFARS